MPGVLNKIDNVARLRRVVSKKLTGEGKRRRAENNEGVEMSVQELRTRLEDRTTSTLPGRISPFNPLDPWTTKTGPRERTDEREKEAPYRH